MGPNSLSGRGPLFKCVDAYVIGSNSSAQIVGEEMIELLFWLEMAGSPNIAKVVLKHKVKLESLQGKEDFANQHHLSYLLARYLSNDALTEA